MTRTAAPADTDALSTLDRARDLVDAAGPVDPGVLVALPMLLGVIAKELGEYDQATRHYAHAAHALDQHGGTPAHAAILEHNRAGLAHAQGQYPTAEDHARRALALRTLQTPKATATEVAADLAVLAAALAGQHRHAEARDHYCRALAACQATGPPRRYEIAVHLHGLAEIAHQQGHLDHAGQLYRRALTLKEQLLGPDHPDIALVANNLGTLLHDQRRDTDAAFFYQRALVIAEHHYPPTHPLTTAIRDNLTALTAPQGSATRPQHPSAP